MIFFSIFILLKTLFCVCFIHLFIMGWYFLVKFLYCLFVKVNIFWKVLVFVWQTFGKLSSSRSNVYNFMKFYIYFHLDINCCCLDFSAYPRTDGAILTFFPIFLMIGRSRLLLHGIAQDLIYKIIFIRNNSNNYNNSSRLYISHKGKLL